MKTLILHDFSREEVFKIMEAVKKNWPAPKELIFATTTPVSVKRKLETILTELEAEHAFFSKKDGR